MIIKNGPLKGEDHALEFDHKIGDLVHLRHPSEFSITTEGDLNSSFQIPSGEYIVDSDGLRLKESSVTHMFPLGGSATIVTKHD